MSSKREQLREIFDQARRLPKPERAAFLDGLAAVDGPMRAQIEDMLAALDEAGVFLSEPTQGHHDALPTADFASAVTMAAPLREAPGTRVGPYRLLQLIGEGGFGSVFMAEQEKPVQRKVALKIIKLGMDTHQVVARFEQERQALAMMDHPNIAKVLDAGATETGRPFFVMELVKGDPIVEYCDRNNLSIHDRLELFAQVCNAVQHAHTKGIIHRDIKPSNILVSTQDGRPHAKVIDFGIAKATLSKLTEKTLFTEHRALIGTPEYMSPEQAEGSLDIDTRTDVYSLGVLLYELLTGTTPFSSKELRSAAYAEIQRIIRDVEPPKPSTRLSNNTDSIASIAAQRRIEPRKLGTTVRGELDWIVMKALEKDRQRRYETASGLAMDIHRYLSGEAVVAAPPGAAYRVKKFIGRNRVWVTGGGAVAGALLIGVIAFAWQAKAARDQRDLAVAAQLSESEQRKAADAARANAQKQEAEARNQAAIAEAVGRFLTGMLAVVDPANLPKDPVTKEPLKDAVTVVQAMQAAVKTLDGGSLKDQPLVEASVRETIGQTFQGLARYDDAEPNLRASVTLRSAALPAGHPHIAASLNNLASLLLKVNKMAEAERLFREATAIWRGTLPAHQTDLASGLDNLAKLLARQNKADEAESLMRESLALRRAALPAGHPDIGLGLSNLGGVLCREDKLGEAEPLLREAIQIRRAALPAQHPDIAVSLNNLAWLLQAQKKLSEAEPLLRESLEINRAVLPAGHPTIAMAMGNLADLLRSQNKLAEAEPLLREALAIQRAALPAGHPDLAVAMNKLAALLQAQDKLSEAETLMIEGLKILRAAVPAGHPDIASDLNNLARVQQGLGKTAEARAAWDEAIPMLRKASPDGSALLARMLWRSGSARLESKGAGGAAAALPELEEAVSMAARFLKPEDPRLKEYRETLARCKAALAE